MEWSDDVVSRGAHSAPSAAQVSAGGVFGNDAIASALEESAAHSSGGGGWEPCSVVPASLRTAVLRGDLSVVVTADPTAPLSECVQVSMVPTER